MLSLYTVFTRDDAGRAAQFAIAWDSFFVDYSMENHHPCPRPIRLNIALQNQAYEEMYQKALA